MTDTEQEIIEKNVRRAAGINALRKIGDIVAQEQQADEEKAKALRWFARYGWIVFAAIALLFSYVYGLI